MRKNESGQALVLVLLSLSVVLTLILYVLSRSVTDVAVSSQQEESVRAFSAAEAGVERALVIGTSNGNTIGDASYTASVTSFAQGDTSFSFPNSLSEGDTATVWFMGHDASGNLTSSGAFTGSHIEICWGNSGTISDSTPAIEVSILYEQTLGNLATVRIARKADDPNTARATSNSFAQPHTNTCSIGGVSYPFWDNINFTSDLSGVNRNGLVLARIRMFYGTSQPVGVSVTGGVLPSQGASIISTGVAGGSNRRINVFQGWNEFPFASESLFAPAGITKP